MRLFREFSTSTPSAALRLAFTVHDPPNHRQNDDAIPIIFLHGLFGSKKNNRSISKVLARDLNRRIYAIDLRNHGDSPHDAHHNYASMTEDLEMFMRDHDLTATTLVGHSMGAKTAMSMALRWPERVASLVVVDNAPVDAALKSDFAKYVQGMKRVEQAQVTKQSEADEILKEYEESLPIRQFLLTNLVRPAESPALRFRIPIGILASALDNMADFPYKDPTEMRYNGPVLVIRGTRSHYVADDTLPVIGSFFPRFELQDVDSGHWVISENPEAFRSAVLDFLRRQEAT
ncbi:MAG: hypothetical protein M1833_005454 [Piccolia ochrophora]|nr:MAG: hypothetical protein M1833_005454 [Piccolia ochrophora]